MKNYGKINRTNYRVIKEKTDKSQKKKYLL